MESLSKVKLSSLVWKIRGILRDNISVSANDCKAIFANQSPYFSLQLVSKKDLNQHCTTKQGPTTTNLTAPELEHYVKSGSLLSCKQLKKLHNDTKTPQSLRKPHRLSSYLGLGQRRLDTIRNATWVNNPMGFSLRKLSWRSDL